MDDIEYITDVIWTHPESGFQMHADDYRMLFGKPPDPLELSVRITGKRGSNKYLTMWGLDDIHDADTWEMIKEHIKRNL